MVRRRQQDLTPGPQQQIVAPKASAINLSFGARAPKPVDKIAFDFRSLSRSLDALSRRSSQDRTRKYEKTAEDARQVFLKAQLEGADSENELFERWQEFASNNGLTEAATVHGQREIARATGRGKAAHILGQVRIKVETALQGEGTIPEDSDTFFKEALETAEIDLDKLDFYQMEGFGPLVDRGRIEFDESLAQEEYMRDTAIIHEAAQSRVVGYFNGTELSVEGLSEIVGGLSTSENGSLYPVNRKPILMNALAEMQVNLKGDSEAFLEILDVVDELDFGGTKFGEDQSSPDLPNGRQGQTYALQLAKMRSAAVQSADSEALKWQVLSTAKINKAIGTTAEYNESLDLGDDGILTNEEMGQLHEEISGLLSNAGLTRAEVASGMQKWSLAMRNLQAGVRTGTSASIAARKTEQKDAVDAMASRLTRGEYTPEDVFSMLDVPGAEEVYGPRGLMQLKSEAKSAAEFTSFTTHPTTKRVGEILSTREGFEGLSADELSALNDSADDTLAEIQSAFKDMLRNAISLPPGPLQLQVEEFVKSSLVTDAVKAHRSAQEEARIKTSNREVELKRITGTLNTEALRVMAGDESLPTALRVKAEEGLILADQRGIPQTWGQFNGFMGELGALFGIDEANVHGIDDERIGALSALIDRQQAGAATEFVSIAQEHFRQGLVGNDRPVTIVQKEALEFAMGVFEKKASTPVARLIRAQDFGGKPLVEAIEANDADAKARNKRVSTAALKQVRNFNVYFQDDPTRTSASPAAIRAIGKDLFEAAELRYGMEPGATGWAEANQNLQIESRRAANEILESLGDDGLTNEQGKQLFQLGQITPGFWSLDDIATTGRINFRTEGNKDDIVRIREKLHTSATEANRLVKAVTDAFPNRSPRMRRFLLDRSPLGKQLRGAQAKQRKDIKTLEKALDLSYGLDNDKVMTGEVALTAVTDKNINPLTVPWKRSYEELLKYKNEKPTNWTKFKAAMGIVDEEQFLAEQRKLFQ